MRELPWILKNEMLIYPTVIPGNSPTFDVIFHKNLTYWKYKWFNDLMVISFWMLYYCVCVCMCACRSLCVGVTEQHTESIHSFHHVSLRDWVIRLGTEYLYSWIMSPDSMTWSFSGPIRRTDTTTHQHLLPIASVGAAKWSSKVLKLLKLVLYQVWSLGLSILTLFCVRSRLWDTWHCVRKQI